MRFASNSEIFGCASDEKYHNRLRDLWFNFDKSRLEATDGKKLVAIPVEIESGDPEESCSVPYDAVVASIKAAKALKNKQAQIFLKLSELKDEVTASVGSNVFNCRQSRYPNTQIVFDEVKAEISFSVSVEYLMDCIKAAGKPDSVMFKLREPESGKLVLNAIGLDFSGEKSVAGIQAVIMPRG